MPQGVSISPEEEGLTADGAGTLRLYVCMKNGNDDSVYAMVAGHAATTTYQAGAAGPTLSK